MPSTILVSIAADGFTPPYIYAYEGDTIDFQPSGPTPPTSVTVSCEDGSELLGSPYPVPGQMTVQLEGAPFTLTADGHKMMLYPKIRVGNPQDGKINVSK